MNSLSTLVLAILLMSTAAHAQNAAKTDARKYAEAVFNLHATDVPDQGDISIDLNNRILSDAARATDVTGSKAQCYVRLMNSSQASQALSEGLNVVLHWRDLSMKTAREYLEMQVKRDGTPKQRAEVTFDSIMFGTMAENAASVARDAVKLQAIVTSFEQVLGRTCGF